MNIVKKFFLVTLLFAGVTEFSTAQKKPTEVIILHTNDMHAKIDNMGKLAYLRDSLQKTHKYVYLLSAGDNFTGNPIVDMYPQIGYPMIDLMNKTHFTLSTVGNHEFDMGQENLEKRRKEAQFPFISANIDVSGTHMTKIKPYAFLKAGCVEIPVLGLIQLGKRGIPDSHPSKLIGLKFTNGIKKAEDYKWLKKKYGMLIALTHLGVEDDSILAKNMPQIDLIIGGHSHTILRTPSVVNGVMIVQAGSSLAFVGKTTLILKDKKIINKKYELIPLDWIKNTNSNVQKLVDKYNNNPEMMKVVAVAEAPFRNKEELGCLMTDAITSEMGTDFAFQNWGGVRVSNIPEGNIPLKQIYLLDPFGNKVIIYKMTYDEIKALVLNSFNRSREIDLYVSGMSYTILTDSKGNGIDVEMKTIAGKNLDKNKIYKVGMNSYISSSYEFSYTEKVAETNKTSAQTLLDYLTKVKKVNYAKVKRTSVEKK